MDITVYGKADCSYCTKAKTMLDDLGITYTYIDIDKRGFDKAHLVTTIAPGAKTVPVVIFRGKYIGGYTELARIMELWKNDVAKLARELQIREWIVTFKKSDGSERVMRCTTDLAKIPVMLRPVKSAPYEGTLIFAEVDPNVGKKMGHWQFNVFETDRQQWRSFVADRIISVRPV